MSEKLSEADRVRNLDCCDRMIAAYELRIINAEETGEDEDELQEALDGYEERRLDFIEDK